MAKTTSFEEVAEAVDAVKLLQVQVDGLMEAMRALNERVRAVEQRLDQGRLHG